MRDAGRIAVACDERAGRTRLALVRTSGLSRSSRSFAEGAGGLRIVFSTLGPGVLAGDRFTLTGDVGAHASLVAAGQMATPVFAGASPSRTEAAWRVAHGGSVTLLGEPVLLEPGSRHEIVTALTLAGDGTAIVAETFALRGPACLRTRSTAWLDGVLAYRDALEVVEADGAAGTVALVAAGAERRRAFAEAAVALGCAHGERVRTGVGETAAAVVVRLTGARVWDVRALAFALADAARSAGRANSERALAAPRLASA